MSDAKINIEGGNVTPTQRAEIEAQVIKLINKYYSSKDNSIIPKEIMHIPYTFMGTAVLPFRSFTDPDTVVESYNEYNKRTMEEEPDKHEAVFTPNNVTVLSPTAAIVSGNNNHLRKDGSLISVHGVVYILAKVPKKGWRIVAFAPTVVDTVIRKIPK